MDVCVHIHILQSDVQWQCYWTLFHHKKRKEWKYIGTEALWPRSLRRGFWALGYWGRKFRTRTKYGCLPLSSRVVLPYIGRGPAMGWSPTSNESYQVSEEMFRSLKKEAAQFSKNHRDTGKNRVKITRQFSCQAV